MHVCASIVGAVIVTASWMFGISYVDYLVASHRRSTEQDRHGTYPQLTAERMFAMPWGQVSWLASGGVVLVLTFASGLLGVGVLLLVSVVGFAIVGAVVLSDWQQLQRQPAVTPDAPTAWLYGMRGEYGGCHIQVPSYGLGIGREARNALRLNERSISRSHAVIRFGHGQWFLQDQNSTHGTFVNGQRVNATPLCDGDRIQIGSAEFEFRIQC